MPIAAGEYSGPTWWPLTLLRDAGREGGMRRLAGVWAGASLLSVLLAVLEARLNWSGLALDLGTGELLLGAGEVLLHLLGLLEKLLHVGLATTGNHGHS